MKRSQPGAAAAPDRAVAGRRYRARRAAAGQLHPESFPLLEVPACSTPLAPLPLRRRRLYEEHLRTLLRALAAGEALPPPAHQVPPVVQVSLRVDRVLQAGCTACKGHCCETGGAHAYQTEDDLRRVRAGRAAAGEEALVALYLGHLPARTVRGSCVFHGRRGCALPRDLRGELCNRFLCAPLLTYRARAVATGEAAAFVLSYDDGLLRGGAFVGGEDG